MAEANRLHVFSFIDVPGQSTGSYTIDVFTVDGNAVDSATSDSFQVMEVLNVGSQSYYQGQYTPSKQGYYFLGASNGGTPVFSDAVDVDEANYVNLTQDTPTVGNLKGRLPVTHFSVKGNPAASAKLSEFLILVINSSDWDLGKTATKFAIASTFMDNDGNWLSHPLVIPPGTYHVIERNNYGTTHVLAAYLEV